ncbi:MAG: hypothetical protein FWE33_01640 [Defluviitaleaceae bacterium]|nr:hypothetical protein [Defluviitaleaceae bacterium]
MTKKQLQTVAFIIILIIGIAGIGGIIYYAVYSDSLIERPFVPERRQTAERMYRETVGIDLSQDYPANPRDLMELYAITHQFLYGNFIALDWMFMEVIEFQRQLFSQELRSANSSAEQFNNLMKDIELISEQGGRVLRAQIYEFTIGYGEDDEALMQVRHRFAQHDDLFRLYHLILDDDGYWRINSWIEADEHFNPIIGANVPETEDNNG